MKREINPQETSRADAFSLWMSSPMPMVTLVKTFNVSKIVKYSKRHDMSFNMLLCWCIGKAASKMEEFYLLPENGKLYHYDKLAVNVIVNNKKGGINSCDIPFCEDIRQFQDKYSVLTQSASESCESSFVDDAIENETKFKLVNGSEFTISEMKGHSIVVHNEQNEKTTEVTMR